MNLYKNKFRYIAALKDMGFLAEILFAICVINLILNR